MRDRLLTAVAIAGAMAAVVDDAGARSRARRRKHRPRRPAGARASIPRTPDGKPDLTGMYDLATLTPVERPAGTPLVLTDEQAAKLEQQAAAHAGKPAQRRSPADRGAPPVGGDGSTGAAGNVGGYNNFWIDAGSRYTIVDGQQARVDRHRPAGRPRAGDDADARQRYARNRARRPRTSRRREQTIPDSKAAAPTTTRSAGRSASAA